MSPAGALRLLVITGPHLPPGRTVVEVVRAALRGGATAVQLREKVACAREAVELARALKRETAAAGALLFVNDRVDVALAAAADGAHLGEEDLPVAAARRIVPPGFLLGASADTPELALRAARDGADYVGVGPVFATHTKPDAGDAVGPERVQAVAGRVRIPVVGIGGISAGTAGRVVRAGAAGVAVISAVMGAADPEAACRELRREVDRALGAG